jgi:hypothetical protein
MQYFLFRAVVPVRNTGWVHWLTSTPSNRSSSEAHRKPLVAAKCRIEFAKAYISHSYSWTMPTAPVESKRLGPRWSKSTQRQFFHKSAIFVWRVSTCPAAATSIMTWIPALNQSPQEHGRISLRAGLDQKILQKWHCSKFRCYLAISVQSWSN